MIDSFCLRGAVTFVINCKIILQYGYSLGNAHLMGGGGMCLGRANYFSNLIFIKHLMPFQLYRSPFLTEYSLVSM